MSVPEHTLYLPVLTQEDVKEEDDPFTPIDRLLDAEHQWETMGVPKSQLVSPAFTFSNSVVVEEEEIERAVPAKVARVFRPLLPWTQQWANYHIASRHAFTLYVELTPLCVFTCSLSNLQVRDTVDCSGLPGQRFAPPHRDASPISHGGPRSPCARARCERVVLYPSNLTDWHGPHSIFAQGFRLGRY